MAEYIYHTKIIESVFAVIIICSFFSLYPIWLINSTCTVQVIFVFCKARLFKCLNPPIVAIDLSVTRGLFCITNWSSNGQLVDKVISKSSLKFIKEKDLRFKNDPIMRFFAKSVGCPLFQFA